MKETQVKTLPQHVAMIMDGNGRWAKLKNRERTYGHRQGADTLEQICKEAYQLGIKYVTVYAFSTENWKRSKEEITFLMALLRRFLKKSVKNAKENNMRVSVIGDRAGLDKDIQKAIRTLETESQDCTGLHLVIALNYGSRDEIRRAVQTIGQKVLEGSLPPDAITEETISHALDTKGLPDPDLVLRTSGEQRLSNFLLWQVAYSEFYFIDKFWPDFTGDDLKNALDWYQTKERRFGGVKK